MVLVANDYYDFNPSPTTWALLLTVVVLFVLALSLLLIVGVDRGQQTGRAAGAEVPTDELPQRTAPAVEHPTTRAS